jgi:hypothetical protein
MSYLFAAGFNVQQMLATGVIGGGAGLMIAVIASLVQKPKPQTDDQPPAKKIHPLVAGVLILAGLVLVVVGIMWRVSSQ